MNITPLRLLAAAYLSALAGVSHADQISMTFRMNGANVEMVASNTTDAPATVTGVKVLGPAPEGKDSPVLLTLTPGTVIPAKQEVAVVLAKIADIRRIAPRAAEFERSKFCVGAIDPCMAGETAYDSFNSGLGVETVVAFGQAMQRTLMSMPVHFVTGYRAAK